VNWKGARGVALFGSNPAPRHLPPPVGAVIAAVLSLFNDVNTREAFGRGFDLIDLRLICNSPKDYANPIEPSTNGGEKIAKGIAAFCNSGASDDGQSKVWVHQDTATIGSGGDGLL
jgi:hypothetical protein